MATDEEPKNAEQNRNLPSEDPVSGVAEKDKTGWVIVGCMAAAFMLFVNPLGALFLIALVLLTIFLDKHAVISDAVRKRNKSHPETGLENVSRNGWYGGLPGCLVGLLFGFGIIVLFVILLFGIAMVTAMLHIILVPDD